MTCDSNHKCQSGQEQGGYLCRTSETRCSLLHQLFGAECKAASCETLLACDNRRDVVKGDPAVSADRPASSCPGPLLDLLPPATTLIATEE